MRILIVEDETAAYENLADMLVTIDPTLEIMGNTESVQQTVRWLQANPRPDLIFMDIHLSDGSAFAIFDQMRWRHRLSLLRRTINMRSTLSK